LFDRVTSIRNKALNLRQKFAGKVVSSRKFASVKQNGCFSERRSCRLSQRTTEQTDPTAEQVEELQKQVRVLEKKPESLRRNLPERQRRLYADKGKVRAARRSGVNEWDAPTICTGSSAASASPASVHIGWGAITTGPNSAATAPQIEQATHAALVSDSPADSPADWTSALIIDGGGSPDDNVTQQRFA
jgi:hypothetical protein